MHPTCQLLIEAGIRIAERDGFQQMSINAIVAEAGVAKGTFYVHFSDRTAYLVALHRWFHDQLAAEIGASIRDFSFGAARLHHGALTYLDSCLQAHAVKALLLDIRGEPAVAEEVQRRNSAFTQVVTSDFEVMGWMHPEACARLYVVMVAEAALVELQTGGVHPATRAALAQFIGLTIPTDA